jgi:hypothetical protein
MIIREQTKKEKNPLFKLIYDIQLHNEHNPLQSSPPDTSLQFQVVHHPENTLW